MEVLLRNFTLADSIQCNIILKALPAKIGAKFTDFWNNALITDPLCTLWDQGRRMAMVTISSTLVTYEQNIKQFLKWGVRQQLFPDKTDHFLHTLATQNTPLYLRSITLYIKHTCNRGVKPSTIWTNYISGISHYHRDIFNCTLREDLQKHNTLSKHDEKSFKKLFAYKNSTRHVLGITHLILMTRFLAAQFYPNLRPACQFMLPRLLCARSGEIVHLLNANVLIRVREEYPTLFVLFETSKMVSKGEACRHIQIEARHHPILDAIRMANHLLKISGPTWTTLLQDKDGKPYTTSSWNTEQSSWFNNYRDWLSSLGDDSLNDHIILGRDCRAEGLMTLYSANYSTKYAMALMDHRSEFTHTNFYERRTRHGKTTNLGRAVQKDFIEEAAEYNPELKNLMVLQTSHDLRPKNKSDAAIQWNNLADAILYDPTLLEDSTLSHLETLLLTDNHPSYDKTADVYLSSPCKILHRLDSNAAPRQLGPTKISSPPQPRPSKTQPIKVIPKQTKPRAPPTARRQRSSKKPSSPTPPPLLRPRRIRTAASRNPECVYSDFSDDSDFND